MNKGGIKALIIFLTLSKELAFSSRVLATRRLNENIKIGIINAIPISSEYPR
jgi:hypothetical protein